MSKPLVMPQATKTCRCSGNFDSDPEKTPPTGGFLLQRPLGSFDHIPYSTRLNCHSPFSWRLRSAALCRPRSRPPSVWVLSSSAPTHFCAVAQGNQALRPMNVVPRPNFVVVFPSLGPFLGPIEVSFLLVTCKRGMQAALGHANLGCVSKRAAPLQHVSALRAFVA